MEIPKFKCRSSAFGLIMTEPKEKSNLERYNDVVSALQRHTEQYDKLKNKDGVMGLKLINETIPKDKELIKKLEPVKFKKQLSETCTTYLKEWIISKKHGRDKEFASKPTEKGKQTEQDGFQLIQDVVFGGKIFLASSKQQLEDEYKTGLIDTSTHDTVIDNKSSYTIFTFPFSDNEIKNKSYYYQGQSYMSLTGKDNFMLCYTLNNTPFEIVDKELSSWCWANNVNRDELPESVAYEIIKNHVYTREALKEYRFVIGTHDTSDFIEIPLEKRVKVFTMVKDDEVIESMHKRVLECRDWVNENWNNF